MKNIVTKISSRAVAMVCALALLTTGLLFTAFAESVTITDNGGVFAIDFSNAAYQGEAPSGVHNTTTNTVNFESKDGRSTYHITTASGKTLGTAPSSSNSFAATNYIDLYDAGGNTVTLESNARYVLSFDYYYHTTRTVTNDAQLYLFEAGVARAQYPTATQNGGSTSTQSYVMSISETNRNKWATFTCVVYCSKDLNDACLAFVKGNTSCEFWISDIKIEKLRDTATGNGNYVLIPKVSDYPLEKPYYTYTVSGGATTSTYADILTAQVYEDGTVSKVTDTWSDAEGTALNMSATIPKGDALVACTWKDKTEDEGGNEGEDTEGEDTSMLITENEFVGSAKVTASDYGTVTQATVSADYLPFTDTLKLSCTKAPTTASVFGLNCPVSAQKTTSNGNVVLLTFYARASSASQKVDACILGESNAVMASYSYYIPTQWTKICMPVTVSGNVTGLSLFGGYGTGLIEFGGVSLYNYGTDAATEATEKLMYTLPQGYFLMEGFEKVPLEYSGDAFTVRDGIDDLCSYENYLFAIGDGEFRVYERQQDNSLSLVGSLSGLGTTRQLRITEDGNTAVVTARASKAYVIDCSDRKNPVIASRYDSVEYATGLAVGDGRAYITNRMFGTEIIDISNPYAVKNLATLRTGEGQSCALSGSTLYIGCWADKCVEVWDVADPSNAKLITKSIPLSGLGDGVVVDGNILYAATGHYETNTAKTVNTLGYGLGNGMDIYDVSDPSNPVRLATVKIDDHFYRLGGDYWKVVLGSDNNKKYAYLINTYTGVYVYDVTDPSAPVRLAHLTLDVDKTASQTLYNSNFTAQVNNGTDRYFPYDVTKKGQDIVTGVCSYNGALYISGNVTGIALWQADYAKDELVIDNRGTAKADSNTFYKLDTEALSAAGLTNIRYAKTTGQVYGAVKYGNYIYAACGTDGIVIFDKDLNQKAVVKAQDITSDIQLFGNRLYTAEGKGGICVYEISNDGLSLTKISGYLYNNDGNNYPVSVVRLSPNANFVLCDSGSMVAELVDFRDINNPVSFKRTRLGGLYYARQASNGTPVANRYLCIYDHLKNVQWYDFGEDNGNDPVYFTRLKTLGMYSGLTSVGDKALVSLKGQYVIFDPSDSTITTSTAASSLTTKYTFDSSSSKFNGKPIVFGNLLLITSKKEGKCAIVDIADVTAPKLLASLSFAGNPDIAYYSDGEIILPLGYQGILKFSLKDATLPADYQMVREGSIRYEDADADRYVSAGVRFKGRVTKEFRNTASEIGFVAIPTALLGDGDIANYTGNAAVTAKVVADGMKDIIYAEVTDEYGRECYDYQLIITGLTRKNNPTNLLNTKITVVMYTVVNGVTEYSDPIAFSYNDVVAAMANQ